MRLVDLPRTTSFQLALRFLLLFGAATLVLCAFLYWQTTHYVNGRVDDWLAREQAVFGLVERQNLVERLNAHVIADPTLERPLTLFGPAGQRLAGTPLALSPAELAVMPKDVPFRFVLRQGEGRSSSAAGCISDRRAICCWLPATWQGRGSSPKC